MTDDAGALEPLPDDWRRALAIVAHPDDLEYGAALAVARWTAEGREVAYVLVTRGEAGIDGLDPDEAGPVREREEVASAAAVGVSTVEFLDHRDGVVEYGLPLRRDLAGAIRRHRPELVVTLNHHLHFPGGHLNMADHRNVGLAVLDAARDAGNRWIFPESIGDTGPWSGTRWVAVAASPSAAHGVDVTGHLDAGVASLECHRAYLEGLGTDMDPRSFLESHARAAGARLGCELAVEFELVSL